MEPVAESAPYQEVRSKREEKRERQKPAARPARPTDPRYQPFYAFAFGSYSAKHGRKPLWSGKEQKSLQTLLKSHAPEALPLERLKLLWEHFATSTEPFTAKQGDSLAYFCSNLDKFSDGPISQSRGKVNGKDTNEAVATTMRGFAVNSGITH
jgi:hypothetical protein